MRGITWIKTNKQNRAPTSLGEAIKYPIDELRPQFKNVIFPFSLDRNSLSKFVHNFRQKPF